MSSAIKTDRYISLFSLNLTSKGHAYGVMPDINNDYVHSLYSEKHFPTSYTSLKEFYSEQTMSTFTKWNETIRGKSIIGIYSNPTVDNSVELFHQFARRWTFGNGDKSSQALIDICDQNSLIAEQYKRPDLKATWQVIKMIYADYNGLQSYRMRSSRKTPSATKNHQLSDSLSSHRHHHHSHHPYHQQTTGKFNNIDTQQQQQQHENEFHDELNGRKRNKSQEQIIPSNSHMGKRKSFSSFYLLFLCMYI